MGLPAQTARNAIIAESYQAGISASILAKRWGLAPSRISVIVAKQGVVLTDAERARRQGAHSKTNGRRGRSRVSVSLRQRIANDEHVGRPRLFPDDLVRRADYLALRNIYGAAYARQAMGV